MAQHSASDKPTVAFFGATGDCAGYCLAAALEAGHQCSALARTPSKLTTSLKAKGVSVDALTRLRIVQGDIRDEKSVADTLKLSDRLVDVIISGIGGAPALKWSLLHPFTITDPTICNDAAQSIVTALRSIPSSRRPLLAVVSTTGIAPKGRPRDIPVGYFGLYKWLLHAPHVDKANMEAVLRRASQDPSETRPFSGFVAVKPTLLMDGPAIGQDKIRHGTEDKPAIGYTIRRSDTGKWMFANLIAKDVPKEWLGKGVCLTA